MRYLIPFVLTTLLLQNSLFASTPMVAGGGYHSLTLKSDGTVWSWGRNNYGQIGNGKRFKKNTPVLVNNLTDVIAIASGTWHSLALKQDGTVWTWGRNDYGQLGNGTFKNKQTPVRTKDLADVIAIAGGYLHSLALKSDGTAWAWGNNWSGQLGNETVAGVSNIPVQVNSLQNISSIACGGSHNLAIRSSDGVVWTWGDNTYGQLGNGTSVNSFYPTQVTGINGATAITGGYMHSLALLSGGTVWGWGNSRYGQLGNDSPLERISVPVQTKNTTDISGISSLGWHNLALDLDGIIWAWGDNSNGQIGNGTYASQNTPAQIEGLEDVADISTGWLHSLAIKSDGTVWAWGDNRFGQLGDGTYKDREKPIQVKNLNALSGD